MSDKKRRNTPGTAAERRLAAERAAAARVRIERAQRRRRLSLVLAAVGAVVVLVAVLIVVKVAVGSHSPKSGVKARAANSSVSQLVGSVPATTLDRVGVGSASSPPTRVSGAALTAGGKPRVLFVGAEFCPYCAAERWAVAVALSRFGDFRNLGEVSSSPSDVYPSTATLSFHGASYSSPYFAFTGKELQSNQLVGSNYGTLDKLDHADAALFEKYGSGYPFLDVGGRYVFRSASYDPQILHGKTQQQIASALADPSSAIAKGVDGAANVVTAAVCDVTNGTPASVCSSAGVRAAAKTLPGS